MEFYPAALEIMERPPSPTGRAVGATIIGFFVVALIWASVGTVDVVAIAPGRIVPTGRTKIIQPLEAGVVNAIYVRDGQHVRAGDVLVKIDSTITAAERDRLQQELVIARLDMARLKAAAALDSNADDVFLPPVEASAEQIHTARAVLLQQRDAIAAKVGGLDKQIAQQEGNQRAVEQTIRKIEQSLPFLSERARIRRDLARKGYSSKIDNLTAQQDLSEHQSELRVQKARLTEASSAVQSLMEQRRGAEAEYQRALMSDLAIAEQKAMTAQEQLKQAEQKYKLQTLTAPVDGTVQQLAVHTEGGVVTPAQALLVIVPAGSSLEIEAMVSNRDIGFVTAGQEAQVKIDTFNFTRYGTLSGRVVSVSRDAIERRVALAQAGAVAGEETNGKSEPRGQEYVYAARVELEKGTMSIDGRDVPLHAGMAVTAEIRTSTRTVMDYLLSPLQARAHQAMRER
ncbi:MAG: HlyD family type I secretion periplasmic adaptor subunit [Parvibaculum sp.]